VSYAAGTIDGRIATGQSEYTTIDIREKYTAPTHEARLSLLHARLLELVVLAQIDEEFVDGVQSNKRLIAGMQCERHGNDKSTDQRRRSQQ